ncbi:MAG: hypothetical protein AABX01_03900 [Candidatus Micrarchaeota archaeon]
MAEQFRKRNTPGIPPLGAIGIGPEEEYFGVKALNVSMYLPVAADAIFSEDPTISYPNFEQKMIAATKKMDSLASYYQNQLSQVSRWEGQIAPSVVTSYFGTIRHMNLPFEAQVKSFRLHAKMASRWLSMETINKRHLNFHPGTISHPETPLVLAITNRFGQTVGTIGGLAYYRNGRPAIGITNIQGKGAQSQFINEPVDHWKKRKAQSKAEYDKLKENLGESWRFAGMKMLLDLLNPSKFAITGHPPSRFSLIGPTQTDEQFRRTQRQYAQTYRKLGFIQQKDGIWLHPGNHMQ